VLLPFSARKLRKMNELGSRIFNLLNLLATSLLDLLFHPEDGDSTETSVYF
jgi:hypothetical protein